MSRSATVVRRADEALHDAILDLWATHRVEAGASPDAAARAVSDGAARAALSRPDVYAFVALCDDHPVGYVVCTDGALNPFSDNGCVAIDQLYVTKDARRSGVARLLLTAVAAHAQRAGSDQVASNVPANGREANRFFARLGFLPSTVRRVTSTTGLHRRLASDAEARVRSIPTKVLARRRGARLRRWQQEGLGTT